MTTVGSFRIVSQRVLISVEKQKDRIRQKKLEYSLSQARETRRILRRPFKVSPPRFSAPERSAELGENGPRPLILATRRESRARGCPRVHPRLCKPAVSPVGRSVDRLVSWLAGRSAGHLTSLPYFFRAAETRNWHQDVVITRERPLFPPPLHRRTDPLHPHPPAAHPQSKRPSDIVLACCE